MIQHYLKSALRHFNRNRSFTLINIIGLSIGIAVSITGFLYVHNQLSYDRFNPNADRIYRIAVDALSGNTAIYQTYTPAVMAATLYDEFPEIEKVTRIATFDDQTFRIEDRIFLEDNVFVTDSTFFDIFPFKVLKGENRNLLSQLYTAVITETTAKKYFGDSDPIGKVLRNDSLNFKVTAVVEDVPQNSHFHFKVLLSLISFDGFYNNPAWFANNFRTYIMLKPNADVSKVSERLPAYTDKYLFGGNYSEITRKGNKWDLYLQPLTSIHLGSDLRGEFEANGRRDYVDIFMIVSIFILLVACINFINLSTAKAAARAREIGVRKTAGACRKELFRQFMTESLLTSFIATAVALFLVELTLLVLRETQGVNLEMPYFESKYTIPLLICLAVLVGLLSGIYPALLMSSFKPLTVMKNQLQRGRRYPWLRGALVAFQFSISVFLIIGTFIIYRQLFMLQNSSLGFSKDHILKIENPSALENNANAFKHDLLSLPYVDAVSAVFRLPGEKFINLGFGAEDFENGFTLNLSASDEDLAKVLKPEITDGRYFSKDYGTDTSAIVINQAAVKLLGYDDPIGKSMHTWGKTWRYYHIIGVVKDIYYESRHQKVMPMGIVPIGGPYGIEAESFAVRFGNVSPDILIRGIEKKWNDYSTGIPFSFSFFDKDYDLLYRNEMQTRQLFFWFALLSILIASLGLLGLAAYTVRQRTREIGVRKVFGATVFSVISKLTNGFLAWILLSNLIAWPLAWYFFDNWLNNFAYRTSITWWYFPMALLISLIITIVTITYQSVKAAMINPADVLRYE